jgi:hypothetical protein
MNYAEKFRFSNFENSKMSYMIEMFCFLLLKADTLANPWIFSDSTQA